MKKFKIRYNPYTNRIHFNQKLPEGGLDSYEWAEIESDSQLKKFQGERCIFENCVEEILELINKYFNTSGELIIEFVGTDEDFDVLRLAVKSSENPKSKGIQCEFVERYPSSSDALAIIRGAYEQIKTEFDDYIDNDELEEDDERKVIGRSITKFQDTVKAEIPVCVIGNYSVGKSALVNALVGLEILPSHANSTTAKNVRLENGQVYTLGFEFKGSEYVLLIDGYRITPQCNGDIDEELIQELTKGTEGLTSEEQILHQIIENLNIETSEESRIAGIESSVRVTVPFRRSELDTDKYSFVFIDTPGSNNGDEAQKIHRENLEKLMDEQTNALPVFVMGRNSLDSNDTNDLRVLLENKEAGFALQNCIIAISMSDQLVERQLSEEMPEKIKRWMSHPTIMYVSPIAAIGEKKANKHSWIDEAYMQIYKMKMGDLSEINPPSYNETPCGRKMTDARKNSITPLLYASGIPSLETEINYFAYRFAEFKKCTNGREYLVTALDLADKKLQEAKERLEKDKQAKIKEQEEIRANLKKKINDVPLPPVNAVICSVRKDFNSTLEVYCNGLKPLMRKIWKQIQDDTTSTDAGSNLLEFAITEIVEAHSNIAILERVIADHCQKNLYDANIKEIKRRIEERFIELTARYMADVQKCVTDEYSKISSESQKELEKVFDENKKGPQLQDVSVGIFDRIRFALLGRLPFKRAQEKFLEDYAKKISDKLMGTENQYGVFAKQCIKEPAEKYSQQITAWSKRYKQSIDSTLNNDNAILSELDEKIDIMESRIEDMGRRLKNLSSVRQMLQNVLPENSEVG